MQIDSAGHNRHGRQVFNGQGTQARQNKLFTGAHIFFTATGNWLVQLKSAGHYVIQTTIVSYQSPRRTNRDTDQTGHAPLGINDHPVLLQADRLAWTLLNATRAGAAPKAIAQAGAGAKNQGGFTLPGQSIDKTLGNRHLQRGAGSIPRQLPIITMTTTRPATIHWPKVKILQESLLENDLFIRHKFVLLTHDPHNRTALDHPTLQHS